MAATPAMKAATQTGVNSNNSVHKLKGPYQIRCLKALLLSPIERTELDRAIGTTNAPEFVKQLRRKGLDILMEKIAFVNRDGHKKWRGKYHLDPKSRVTAHKMLGGE